MTGGPVVSVVVPSYGYGRYLEASIGSILGQEGVDVRVLIIDDASPDDSAADALRIAAREPRVEARIHEVNAGHIATYNEGLLEWAQGDYVVLLSADDLLTPGALVRAVRALEDNPSAGFVYGHPIDWNDAGPRPAARTTTTGTTVWSGQEWLRIVCRLGHTVVSGPTVVVRTELQQRVGGYRGDLPHTADVEMWMRLAAHADVAFVRDCDQAYYRIHGSQMSVERVPLVDLRQRKSAYDALFATEGDRIDDAPALRRRADRAMAKEALWRACRAHERGRTDSVPVDDLEAFALASYDGATRLPEYWGLRWRRRAGPRAASLLQPLMLSAVHRKVRKTLWWRRWARHGV
jgi:glycosyltransferase involved in cell wall biosynthesis